MTDLRKGSYAGRWEVYADDVHIGWAIRNDAGTWDAYVSAVWGVEGRQVGWELATRNDAVTKVVTNRQVWS
jgi:hypothetical protein